jgi:maltose alpha-D-glucosyltransferase/alpha-amylase
MLDVLAYWSNIGVDIFRMDAIPYYIKKKGTNAENLEETHEVIKLLSSFVQAIAPRSVMQAEACQWPEDILPYFGEEESTSHNVLCGNQKMVTRTDEVQIAYHFPYMPAIWASMLTNDNSHFWKAFAQTPEIPDTTTWTVFLRVHDELTLEMVDVETRKLIYGNLVEKGAEFRKGFGVSGRMANFLDNKPDRIGLAFSILMSMPGIPLIYYGDEIGAQNNWRYAKASEAKREAMAKEKGADLDVISFFDSRDINRGPITKETFYEAQKNDDIFSGKIYQKVRNLIHLRKNNAVMRRGEFEKLDTEQKETFAYLRTLDSDQILVINNLSGNSMVSEVELPENTAGKIKETDNLVDLISGEKVSLTPVSDDCKTCSERNILVSLLKGKSSNTYKIHLDPYQSVWIKVN